MGRVDTTAAENQGPGKNKRKSKGRMSYLKRRRGGGGGAGGAGKGGPSEPVTDEHGQLYGDYEPAYVPRHQGGRFRKWEGNGGGGGGGRGGRRHREFLKPGMKGFLCTTNYKEWDCVRDAYNILNEYSGDKDEKVSPGEKGQESGKDSEATPASSGDQKSQEKTAENVDEAVVIKTAKETDAQVSKDPPPTDADKLETSQLEEGEISIKSIEIEIDPAPEKTNEKEGKGGSEDEDIASALNNELKDLKNEHTEWKFKSVETGVTNVVFIKTTIDDPTELAYKVFEDALIKKKSKSRSLMRLLPIEVTCNVSIMDEVTPKVRELVEKHMKEGYLSYKISVNSRYNNWFVKEDIVLDVARMVQQVNPLSYVDLNNPQYTILIEVLRSTMCLGLVKDFMKYKKFNLMELTAPPRQPFRGKGKGSNATDAADKKEEESKAAAHTVGPSGDGPSAPMEETVKAEGEGDLKDVKVEDPPASIEKAADEKKNDAADEANSVKVEDPPSPMDQVVGGEAQPSAEKATLDSGDNAAPST